MLEVSGNRIQGKVSWFNEKRGFGLVKLDDNEIFVHHSEINVSKEVYKFLGEGEDVEFEVVEVEDKKSGNKKLCAKNLSGVNGQKLICETVKNKVQDKSKNKRKTPKNTQNFEPSHEELDMNIRVSGPGEKYKYKCTPNDVIVVNNLFCKEEEHNIYELLLNEIKNANVDQENLWKLWHGDTHLIADDHLNWKEECPTFNMVLEKIKSFFNMKIKATRFNWYKDTSQWKPFHHDAAAIKPHVAKVQNLTVGISFGAERDAAFEHAKTNTRISIPQPNGSLYAFGNKVNLEWKHGIPQLPPEKQSNNGRISVIAWGWVDM